MQIVQITHDGQLLELIIRMHKMSNTLNKIEVTSKFKHLHIREINESGEYHRRAYLCNSTIPDDEHQEVKDKTEELWTDEVKSAWATFQAEQEAKFKTE